MLFNIFQAYFNISEVILWVGHVKETLWFTSYKIGNYALYIFDLCCMFKVLIPKEEFQNWNYSYQACWKNIVAENSMHIWASNWNNNVSLDSVRAPTLNWEYLEHTMSKSSDSKAQIHLHI